MEGVIRPDTGDAHLDGQPVGSGPWQHRRFTGGVGHRGRAYPLATLRQNLEFVHSLAPENAPGADELLARLSLQNLADRPADAISAGQRQRLELALALARSPRLLLLDEAFAGLDAASAGDLRTYLAQLPAGVTVILSTHEPAAVWDLADHVLGLVGGRVALDCPTAATDPDSALRAIVADPVSRPVGKPPQPRAAAPTFGRWSDFARLSGMELSQVWRSRRDAGALFTFALLIMLTVSLALQTPLSDASEAAIGGFWASLVFAAVTGSSYGFPRLRTSGSLDLLLALPLARPAILAAQALAQLVRLLPTALVGLVAASVFFEANLLTPAMIALAASGSVALAAVAAAYGALLAMAGARAVLGPLLMLPAALPVVLAGVLSAPAAIGQTSVLQTLQALGLGLAYAALVGAVSILAIEEILVE